jgi:opacity protein-like surface antigen
MQKLALFPICLGTLYLIFSYLNNKTKEDMQDDFLNRSSNSSDFNNSSSNSLLGINQTLDYTDCLGVDMPGSYSYESNLPSYSLENYVDHIPLTTNGMLKSAIILPRKKSTQDTLHAQPDSIQYPNPISADSLIKAAE